MKIAIPAANGKRSSHFGHCEQFAILTVENGRIARQEYLTPPPHAPGVIPNWLADQGCTDIIAGGMGKAARDILTSRGLKITCGAPSDTPEQLAGLYLRGELVDAGSTCEHGHDGHHEHHCHSHGCGRH
ncbi:MAG: NifB/NifX family molybdenum-iron cluster-binding protein [Sporomusaceae bacterium]|nr:NifB/NifX family molybdenum-iron cluster-binding protein [Sporomusaceae bacterium]